MLTVKLNLEIEFKMSTFKNDMKKEMNCEEQ